MEQKTKTFLNEYLAKLTVRERQRYQGEIVNVF